MSEETENVDPVDHCSFVSIHYIICECGETFPSEDALKDHLEKEHPHKKERKEYKCGICSEVYDTEDECIEHYEACHIPVGINLNHCEAEDSDEFDDNKRHCLEEGEVPPEEVALEEAIESIKQETVETLETGEIPLESGEIPVFIDMPRAKAPRRRRKIIPKTGDPEPELVFVIQKGQKRGQLVSMLKKSGRLPKGMRTIVCEVCGKSYASDAALRYHQRTHTGERPYACPYCPKAFTMPLFLQVHVRVHTGERPYQCEACPKNFSNQAALLRHNRVHTGVKPYQCPMCSKAFTQSNSMKLHVTTVHLKQPTPYKSRKRKIKAEERALATNKINPRTKPPCSINSIEVLKSGLESYVLGPLKTDLENLKADIDALATEELDESTNNSIKEIKAKMEFKKIKTEESMELNDDCDYVSGSESKPNVYYQIKDGNVYEVIEETVYEESKEVVTDGTDN